MIYHGLLSERDVAGGKPLLDVLNLNIDYYKLFNKNKVLILICVFSNKILTTLPPRTTSVNSALSKTPLSRIGHW
ncbi:isoleucyl-tRNA synthetase [Klebsiella oxytoca]|nr:isoleucyl-tRNA synthetase [Klebsiella oxytoca]